MRSAITLALDAKGKATLVAGPEVPIGQQKTDFAKLRSEELPKGVASVELWTSDGGRVRKTSGPVKQPAPAPAAPAASAAKKKNPAAK